ncbi:MAG: DUF1846 domain-containing protein [Chloroflexota bacterium]
MRRGFSTEKYLAAQTQAIKDRVAKFSGRLYLEFGGKLIEDYHAARVLPGYDPDAKINILRALQKDSDLVFCVSAHDIQRGRIRGDFGLTYDNATLKTIEDLGERGLEVTAVIISRFTGEESAQRFRDYLENRGVRTYLQPEITGYPTDIDRIVSDAGYGAYPYIQSDKHLIVVTGAGPGSGKMGTCLAQVYLDARAGRTSGYAKFETFPIWNLSLAHPVNLAYEAATADLADKNMIDPFHLEAYGIEAVNYNRDVENFAIMRQIISRIISHDNPMAQYRSPTDMGVNMAGAGIIDDAVVREAGRQEIIRRFFRYNWEVLRRVENQETADRVRLLMSEQEIAPTDRAVVQPARRVAEDAEAQGEGHQGVFCGAAIELPDGTIVTGKNSPLLHAESAAIINAIKQLAQIPDGIHLLAPGVLESISHLKIEEMGGRAPSLNVAETLVCLAMSSATNPTTQAAIRCLSRLRGCEMHTTHAPSRGDEDALRKLGINFTTDARPVLHRFLVR